MPVALGARRSSHSLVVIGWPVAGLLPNPHQYPSDLIASFGMDPSTTSTNGSSSPRSALCHHSMNVSAPCSGPHSKSISGQCTATLGSPGRAPSTISSMLGCVAAVSATESPSQPRPPFIQRMWTTGSSDMARHPSGRYSLTQAVGSHMVIRCEADHKTEQSCCRTTMSTYIESHAESSHVLICTYSHRTTPSPRAAVSDDHPRPDGGD